MGFRFTTLRLRFLILLALSRLGLASVSNEQQIEEVTMMYHYI